MFYNRYSFDLKVLICDPNTGQVFVVTVSAGKRRVVDVPHAGDYGFVVVGVNAPGVNGNVGVGVFNGGGPCNQHCSVPRRPSTNAQIYVNVQVGNVYQPYGVWAYDCGCGPVYRRDDRDYYRYYFEGHREVVGYWQGTPRQEGSRFVPVEYRQTPVAQAVPVTPQNVMDVVTGSPPKGGDPQAGLALPGTDGVLTVQQKVLIVAGLIGVAVFAAVAGVAYLRSRRGKHGA